MDVFDSVLLGFATALTPTNIFFCFVGVFTGTVIGVLPGLGPTATISLLIPVTFQMDTTGAVIMLAGIYYGAMYGGSITSILVNIPGEAASVITCIDGHQMAKNGRAGPALGIAAFGSLFAGVATVAGIVIIGPPLAQVALEFGPPENFSLILFGLILVVFISTGSKLRSLMSALVGIVLSTIGLDIVSGEERFTFGMPYLLDGIHIIVLAMGLFGVGEVLSEAERRQSNVDLIAKPGKTSELMPTKEDWRASAGPITRGTLLGFFLGLLPGSGAMVASFASYVLEKKISKTPERFGHGAIEGVAGPESANNAGAQASFVPLLNLGIPTGAVMGVVLGVLMIHGISPGPLLYIEQPELFWGVVISMLIGNVMLVILNVPLIGIFVKLLSIPASILSPMILVICIIGSYSINNNIDDVIAMFIAGLCGYLMKKAVLDPAPLIVSFVLGRMLEESLHSALAIGYGSASVFFLRPISAALLACAALVIIMSLFSDVLVKKYLQKQLDTQ